MENHTSHSMRDIDITSELILLVGAVGPGAPLTSDDTLTLSHQNIVTQYWMQKNDPALPALVAVEYTTEIVKRADALLKTKGQFSATKVVIKVKEHKDEMAAQISKLNFANNSRSRPDRREQRDSGPVFRRPGNQQGSGSFCPGRKYLGDQLKLQIMFNHNPSECPRKNSVIRAPTFTDAEDVDVSLDDNDVVTEVNKLEDSYNVFDLKSELKENMLNAYGYFKIKRDIKIKTLQVPSKPTISENF